MTTIARPLSAAALCRPVPVAYARRMNGQPEDAALMFRYRDGDVAAFEMLYRRHSDSLYRYLLRLSLNPQTADDVFQDAWSKIINARDNYRPTAKFTTYLFRVAHNCFIDHLRRNKRHEHPAGVDPDSSADPGDLPEEATEKHLAKRRLNDALAGIPEEQRDVFLLREEAGLSVDEIALVTGVNRETAKSRLRYANEKLKAALLGDAADTAGARQHSEGTSV